MCLPFMHKWKDHYRVFSDYGVRGDTVWDVAFPSRYQHLGRMCQNCGKWDAAKPGDQPPRRGRVKRQTKAFRQPLTDAEKARQDALRNVWSPSSYFSDLSSYQLRADALGVTRGPNARERNPWLA